MSLSETQEIFQLLTQIDKVLADIELKIDTIEKQAPMMKEHLMTTRQVLRLTTRLMHLFAHMGFPSQVQQVIRMLNKIIFTVRALHMSLMLLQSTTLYGQVMGVLGGLTIAFTMPANFLEGY